MNRGQIHLLIYRTSSRCTPSIIPVTDNFYRLSSSDDPLIMAGLGTIGLEVITQLPEADAVIVPAASGGMLAAVLVACKKLKCSCLVYVRCYVLLYIYICVLFTTAYD